MNELGHAAREHHTKGDPKRQQGDREGPSDPSASANKEGVDEGRSCKPKRHTALRYHDVWLASLEDRQFLEDYGQVSRNIALVEESMSNGTRLQRRPMVVKPAVISCSGHYCRKAKVVVDGGKDYEDPQAKAKERQRAEVETFPDRHIIRPFQPQIREHDEKERRREDRGKASQVSTAEEKSSDERVTSYEREVDRGEQEEDSQRVREVPNAAVGGRPPVHGPEDEEDRERNLRGYTLSQANEQAVDSGGV